MKLTKINYSENLDTPQEWVLDEMLIGDRNLLVGKNATGKSRILNLIASLAAHLLGAPPSLSGNYKFEFSSTKGSYVYEVSFDNLAVTYENLTIDNELKISRNAVGVGQIFTENLGKNGAYLDYQSPTNALAVVARRDDIQHSYLEPLHRWAAGLRHFRFGTNLGKDSFNLFIPGGPQVNDRDQNQIAGILRDALRDFGDLFLEPLKADLAAVGYQVTDVGLAHPVSIKIEMQSPHMGAHVSSIYVREEGLPAVVDQHSMSQGMFRVLSILIWFNYFQLKNSAACCVVDDIGEGVDFERSCNLIEVLRTKSLHSEIQLIMSTNDKNVMNGIPLKEWAILVRSGGHVHVRNYSNSKEIFDKFRFTGLSNFSFFELDVVNTSNAESTVPSGESAQ